MKEILDTTRGFSKEQNKEYNRIIFNLINNVIMPTCKANGYKLEEYTAYYDVKYIARKLLLKQITFREAKDLLIESISQIKANYTVEDNLELIFA
jgi:hypothetical protein